MAAVKAAIETFSFDGEVVGSSAAAALRKIKSLSELAPQPRLFSAIATLTDIGGQAALEFEAAGLAVLKREQEASESHLHRGMRLAKRLKDTLGAEMPTELPAFIRRRQ
jgi:hypothetical protein